MVLRNPCQPTTPLCYVCGACALLIGMSVGRCGTQTASTAYATTAQPFIHLSACLSVCLSDCP